MSTHLNTKTRQYKTGETIIGALSVGALLILIGAIYVTTLPTSLWDKTVAFFNSFNSVQIQSTTIYLPAPVNPGIHTVVYSAAFQFCIGIAILQIIVLALRLLWRSPIDKTSEAVGNLVFWCGACYLVPTFLNSAATETTWFAFWAAILVTIGISMIARAIVFFVKKQLR